MSAHGALASFWAAPASLRTLPEAWVALSPVTAPTTESWWWVSGGRWQEGCDVVSICKECFVVCAAHIGQSRHPLRWRSAAHLVTADLVSHALSVGLGLSGVLLALSRGVLLLSAVLPVGRASGVTHGLDEGALDGVELAAGLRWLVAVGHVVYVFVCVGEWALL